MTDLTEQWKKGVLDIDECYFAETEGGIYKGTGEYLNNSSCINGFDITSILEPVPSYEELEKLNWYAGNGVEENQELKMKNAQLKELLKECESSIQYYQETYGAMDLDTYTLLAKLNEVLNE